MRVIQWGESRAGVLRRKANFSKSFSWALIFWLFQGVWQWNIWLKWVKPYKWNSHTLVKFRSSRSQIFLKIDVLKTSQISRRLATLLTRHSNTRVFLWSLWIFWERLFYRTPSGLQLLLKREPNAVAFPWNLWNF